MTERTYQDIIITSLARWEQQSSHLMDENDECDDVIEGFRARVIGEDGSDIVPAARPDVSKFKKTKIKRVSK